MVQYLGPAPRIEDDFNVGVGGTRHQIPAKGLNDRLLGGKPTRNKLRPVVASRQYRALALAKYPNDKSIAVFGKQSTDAFDFHNVDSYARQHVVTNIRDHDEPGNGRKYLLLGIIPPLYTHCR
jgi:hypothetical protein